MTGLTNGHVALTHVIAYIGGPNNAGGTYSTTGVRMSVHASNHSGYRAYPNYHTYSAQL